LQTETRYGAETATHETTHPPGVDMEEPSLEDEAYYHGDTALCAFGPERRFLLAYLDALMPAAVERLRVLLGDDLILLSAADAALYAANSFTLAQDGQYFLFMPAGISETLQGQVRERRTMGRLC
jgi:hypothetical protein